MVKKLSKSFPNGLRYVDDIFVLFQKPDYILPFVKYDYKTNKKTPKTLKLKKNY